MNRSPWPRRAAPALTLLLCACSTVPPASLPAVWCPQPPAALLQRVPPTLPEIPRSVTGLKGMLPIQTLPAGPSPPAANTTSVPVGSMP